MQFDVFSFLAGMIATLVLGFVFRRMFAFHVKQTNIHHYPGPESTTAQAMQKVSSVKRAQTDNVLRRGDATRKTSGHVGKLINFDVARERLAKKNSPPDEAS